MKLIFTFREAGGLSGFLSLFYAFHILVLILSVKVYEIERKSRLNTRMKFHRFYWLSYSICYGGTIFYFLLIDDEVRRSKSTRNQIISVDTHFYQPE